MKPAPFFVISPPMGFTVAATTCKCCTSSFSLSFIAATTRGKRSKSDVINLGNVDVTLLLLLLLLLLLSLHKKEVNLDSRLLLLQYESKYLNLELTWKSFFPQVLSQPFCHIIVLIPMHKLFGCIEPNTDQVIMLKRWLCLIQQYIAAHKGVHEKIKQQPSQIFFAAHIYSYGQLTTSKNRNEDTNFDLSLGPSLNLLI